MNEITLINPLTTRKYRLPPLGLLYLASFLERNGVDVRVIDPLPQTNEDYSSESPYVGISCNTAQIQKAKQIAGKLKTENPEATIVFGGVHPTVATKEVLSDPNVDIVVVGEGEKALLKIMKEDIKEGIVQSEITENLDEVPFPARHLVNMDWYSKRSGIIFSQWLKATSMMTSRGCPYSCHYCINSKHVMFGRKVRYHSPEYVEKEIEEIVSNYSIEGILFVDDNFVLNEKRLTEICRRIKRFDLKWTALSRVDTITEEKLRLMKSSGCVAVNFGVESGSQKVLNALNKNTRIEDTIKAFDLCREVGVKTWANIIVGNPQETKKEVESTDELLERIKPDYLEISYLTPYRGTVIYDLATENGWITEANPNWFNDKPQMEISFTSEELQEIREYLMKKHSSKSRWLRYHLGNPYFIYDVLLYLAKKPSFFFRWVKGQESFFER